METNLTLPDTHIYLDHAATTPVAPEVIAAMLPHWQAGWGNPSSLYAAGRAARAGRWVRGRG